MSNTLSKLQATLDARKDSSPDESYVASLYDKGNDKILKKIGEEATELIIAGKAKEKDEIIYEMADLLFHAMVLLAHNDMDIDEVLNELERRFGTSGIAEKNSRPK